MTKLKRYFCYDQHIEWSAGCPIGGGELYKADEADAVIEEQAGELFYWKKIAKSALGEKTSKLKQIKQLQARIARLEGAKGCPYCDNQGWYSNPNHYTGEPEQVQCEFCYTEPNSIFNVRQESPQVNMNNIIADWIEANGFEMDGDVLIREGHLAKLRGGGNDV